VTAVVWLRLAAGAAERLPKQFSSSQQPFVEKDEFFSTLCLQQECIDRESSHTQADAHAWPATARTNINAKSLCTIIWKYPLTYRGCQALTDSGTQYFRFRGPDVTIKGL